MTITTLCDLLDSARTLLDDLPDPVTDAPDNLALLQDAAESQDESNLLWTTAELMQYANEAANEVAIRTGGVRDSSDTVGLTSFAISDNSWQTVDSRILRVVRVTWDGEALPPMSKNILDRSRSGWSSETGEPTHFVFDQAERLIRVYPAPTTAGTLKLEVVRLPVTVMAAADDEPEIAEHQRANMVHWMLHRAYLKNDADTHDSSQSAQHFALFEAIFGPRPTHAAIEFTARSLGVTPRASQHWY
mgnify:CR=1 FL=1